LDAWEGRSMRQLVQVKKKPLVRKKRTHWGGGNAERVKPTGGGVLGVANDGGYW